MNKRKLKDIDREKFSEKMHSESDRSCAILGAALLDAKLEELFGNRLVKFKKELLTGTGPISTFSAKIRLANALAWIANPVQKDLDRIRKIRNDFAHSFDHDLSFEFEAVSGICKNLIVSQHYLEGCEASKNAPGQNLSVHAIETIKEKLSTPRWRFQLTVDFISQYLDDLNEYDFEKQGVDFLEEVFELSAGFRVKISATGIVVSDK